VQLFRHSGLIASRCPGMTKGYLRPRPLVAHAQEFHRPVRYRDPEGRADGAFHQMDVAAMSADQLCRDRKSQPAAAGPAGGLECLEQVIAGLLRNARAGCRKPLLSRPSLRGVR